MNEIEVYVKYNADMPAPTYTYNIGPNIYVTPFDIPNQAKSFNIDCNVTRGPAEEIPRKVKSSLFIILDERTLIPNDYLIRVTSISNLHRDMSLAFGPQVARSNQCDLNIGILSNSYHCNDFDTYSGLLSFTVNKEEHNYPGMNGCIFSSNYYNLVGGYAQRSLPRFNSEYNHKFFKSLDSFGPMIYHKSLEHHFYLSKNDLSEDRMSEFYYKKGAECFDKGINPNMMKVTLFKEDRSKDMLASAFDIGYMEAKTSVKLFDA